MPGKVLGALGTPGEGNQQGLPSWSFTPSAQRLSPHKATVHHKGLASAVKAEDRTPWEGLPCGPTLEPSLKAGRSKQRGSCPFPGAERRPGGWSPGSQEEWGVSRAGEVAGHRS